MQMISKIKKLVKAKVYKWLPYKWMTVFYNKRLIFKLKLWVNEEWIFIHIPKNAGTSVIKSMNRDEIGHFTYQKIHEIFPDKKNFFSVVRCPIERIASAFFYAKKLKLKYGATELEFIAKFDSLEDFIERGLTENLVNNHYFFWTQTKYLDGLKHDHIELLDFNKLSSDYKSFIAKHGLGFEELKHENISKNSKLASSNLSFKAKKKIRDLYQEDYDNSLLEPFVS